MGEIDDFSGHGNDRRFAGAPARGPDILRCCQPGAVHLSDAEPARRSKLARTTLQRLICMLTKPAYLNDRAQQATYQPGRAGPGYRMPPAFDAAWRVRL